MQSKKDILWRVYLVYVIIVLFGIAVLTQVFRLQFVEGAYWKEKADSLTIVYKNIEAARGNILAADGALLATSLPIYDIRMDLFMPALSDDIFNNNIDSLAYYLHITFKDKSQREYARELKTARKHKERYYLIRRNVTHPELRKMRNWPLFRLGRYKGGFIVMPKNKRERPFRVLAARTIGYDIKGLNPVGLEGAYAEYLEGVSGKRLMQRISGGTWMPINSDNEVEPKDGCDLVTTIDVNIQDVAEYALLNQLSKHNADHGCVVLMEVHTGEVKAIANLSRNEDGSYGEYYNYAIGESTEPGSTFKLVSLIAALEDGYITIDDSVDTQGGEIRYYDQVMRDSKEGGYGKITVQRAFEVSSNVGISKIINQNYSKKPQAFVDQIYKMSLNKPLGLQIAGEGQPVIKNTKGKNWYGTTLPWMSIGYEVRLTPLQLLAFYNSIANNGKMVKPMFVREVRYRGKLVKKFFPVVLNEAICSKNTVKAVKKMLEGVVERGTAINLRGSNYEIAGKTGTVQIANDKYGYKYKTKISYQASFVGYFPAKNPTYSCIVVVSSPSNSVYYGNVVAGPVFKEIADRVYSSRLEMHDGIKESDPSQDQILYVSKTGKEDDLQAVYEALNVNQVLDQKNYVWARIHRVGNKPQLRQQSIKKDITPDVTGMGLRDALYLLEQGGFRVRVTGRGTVKKQSVPAGQKIQKNSEIIIELS